ncbi:phage tail tube protein [Deefgea rivuli]|uniref:phage tail tube protein n=1 Tax=Deefgea rivuli TaxID=400948 RepID=UPI0004818307|nr:phage tail tube protein [Deefgea rivuli]
MPLTRKKLLVAKIEATYGVDAVPTGAQAIQVNDLSITPLDNDLVDRNLIRAHLGSSDKLPGGARVKIDCTVEMTGSGAAGTVPNIDVLLRACGMAAVITASIKVEYTPVSGAFESATLYYNQDGLLHKATGCRGTWSLDLTAKDIAKLKLSFTGIYSPVTDAAMLVPTYAAVQTPVVVSAASTAVTLHGFAGKVESMSADCGNEVVYRELIGVNAKSVEITNRAVVGEITMEMPTVTAKDWFAIAMAATSGVLAIQHGTVAGNIVAIDAPKVSVNNPSYQDSDGYTMLKMGLAITPNAGNDEIKLTFK